MLPLKSNHDRSKKRSQFYVDGAKFLAKTALFDSVVSVMKMSYVSKHKTTNSQILDSAIDYLSSDVDLRLPWKAELLVVQSPKNRRYSVNIPSNLTHDGLVKALVHLSLITAAYKKQTGLDEKENADAHPGIAFINGFLKEYDPYTKLLTGMNIRDLKGTDGVLGIRDASRYQRECFD